MFQKCHMKRSYQMDIIRDIHMVFIMLYDIYKFEDIKLSNNMYHFQLYNSKHILKAYINLNL